MRGWAAAILVLLSACARHPEAPLFTGEPYLLVWTGDADRQNSDFLAVLDADPTSPSYGKVLRTYPVRSRGNEPQALIAAPRAGRLVTTNAGHGYAATTRSERMPGISVQVWQLDGLGLPKTAILDADKRGEENLGPITARFLQRKSVLYVGTDQGSALYATDSIGSPSPVFQLAFDFGPGALGGGTAITPDDRFLVEALGGSSRVASLDLADPWHPKLVSAVRLDRDPLDTAKARRGGPHGLAMSADGTRIAVADYTVDVPGYRQDGDHRVYMLRLDPATGWLRIDGAFQDELTGEVGVSFERASWPHGETGPARPAGLLFVTAEPPPAKGRREGE